MTSHLGPAVKGAAFGLVLAVVPPPMRRWMLTMVALGFAIVFTIQHAPSYEPWNYTTVAEQDAAYAKSGGVYGFAGYQYPWYCIVLIIAFVIWGTYGYVRALILSRVYRRRQEAAGQTLTQRVRAATNSRVLIAVDGTPRPPQSPTGPSPSTTVPPTVPPPAPTTYERPNTTPMGSNLPTLWVPTYSGPAQPVQRIETTLGGTLVHDHRRVDPDEL